MPEITLLGWIHTAFGAIAIICGAYALIKHKVFEPSDRSSQLYLLATLITALTALGIYQRGEFGPGHALAIMTLLAVAVGFIAAKTTLFGRLSRYLQAASFTATLLFHSIPAITDGLLRLPVGDPVLSSIDDPVLKMAYGVMLLLYLIGLALQVRWLSRR
ncbi:MAG: hypothetical protein DHS20C11_32810 [Lysobacteraceae bacterium]|nr:MAG: hypothetical protein DHS20C11_32810 [Xanthomonadaceae bacterium]